jgi:hypothetical protein
VCGWARGSSYVPATCCQNASGAHELDSAPRRPERPRPTRTPSSPLATTTRSDLSSTLFVLAVKMILCAHSPKFPPQGRPLRIKKTPFIMNWENNRQDEIKDLTSRGIVPVGMEDIENRPFLMGQVCAMVNVRWFPGTCGRMLTCAEPDGRARKEDCRGHGQRSGRHPQGQQRVLVPFSSPLGNIGT